MLLFVVRLFPEQVFVNPHRGLLQLECTLAAIPTIGGGSESGPVHSPGRLGLTTYGAATKPAGFPFLRASVVFGLGQTRAKGNYLKVPASFADQFCGFRGEIGFVRNRLAHPRQPNP